MRAFLIQLQQTTKGQKMGTATLEVSGVDAAHWALEIAFQQTASQR